MNDKMWYIRNGQAEHLNTEDALDGQFCPRCGRDCSDYEPKKHNEFVMFGECIECYTAQDNPITLRKQAKHQHMNRLLDMLHQRRRIEDESAVREIHYNLYGAD